MSHRIQKRQEKSIGVRFRKLFDHLEGEVIVAACVMPLTGAQLAHSKQLFANVISISVFFLHFRIWFEVCVVKQSKFLIVMLYVWTNRVRMNDIETSSQNNKFITGRYNESQKKDNIQNKYNLLAAQVCIFELINLASNNTWCFFFLKCLFVQVLIAYTFHFGKPERDPDITWTFTFHFVHAIPNKRTNNGFVCQNKMSFYKFRSSRDDNKQWTSLHINWI